MQRTLDYYEVNASRYAGDTISVDFSDIHNRFVALLPDKGSILDFGCGSGRDPLFFINNGFSVDAVDGSEKLCMIASRNTGIAVHRLLFSELNAYEKYDGIWACASILHLEKALKAWADRCDENK